MQIQTSPRKIFAAALFLLALLTYFWIFRGLPTPGDLSLNPPPTPSVIYDRHGVALYYFQQNRHRIPIELSEVSQAAIDATLAIEDRNFFHHHGFSITGILRALRTNLTSSSAAAGGSTITQQLVKNRLLTREKRFTRKVRELVLATWVELVFSKKEILAMYLNEVSYGGTVHGIEAAAWRYFSKSAAELTIPEGALLAGLLKAPGVYNPLGGRPELAFERQKQVLASMRRADFISPAQYRAFAQSSPSLAPGGVKILAPHFVMYVRQLLIEQFGEERLHRDGLQITTTLDYALQESTQERLTNHVKRLFRYRVANGAVLITAPRSGQILSMVGSADYFNAAIDGQVNVVLQYRQPGSTIKPLNYAMSLEHGKTPLSLLQDQPVEYAIPGEESYKPRNDDSIFHGAVTLRQALASSYNVPAVKELASNGVLNFVDKAKAVGIHNWRGHTAYRYALTLGSAEVRMLDLAQLYSTFANLGAPVPPNPLLQVTTLQGDVLYANDCALNAGNCASTAVFSPQTAFLINDILSDNEARSATFGPNSDLHIRAHQVAAKTGTTDYLRDNWTIGYTTDRLVAVWIGNNDGRSMRFIESGRHGASTIWQEIMRNLLMGTQPHRFEIPEGIVEREVCVSTETLACSTCPDVRKEFFSAGTEPRVPCVE